MPRSAICHCGRLVDQMATRSWGLRPSFRIALPRRLTALAYSRQLTEAHWLPALKCSAGASGRRAAVTWNSAGMVSGSSAMPGVGSGRAIAFMAALYGQLGPAPKPEARSRTHVWRDPVPPYPVGVVVGTCELGFHLA